MNRCAWILLLLMTTVFGCAAFDKFDRAMKANMADPREPAMMQEANVSDGYEMLVGNPWSRFASPPAMGKFKWCGRIERFMKEPGEPTTGEPSYFPTLRADIAALTSNGSVGADRYHAGAGSGVYVSVPATERLAFSRNIEAGRVCFWSEGKVQSFPSPRGQGTIFHAMISKWTGVLQKSAPVAPAPSAVPASSLPNPAPSPVPEP